MHMIPVYLIFFIAHLKYITQNLEIFLKSNEQFCKLVKHFSNKRPKSNVKMHFDISMFVSSIINITLLNVIVIEVKKTHSC